MTNLKGYASYQNILPLINQVVQRNKYAKIIKMIQNIHIYGTQKKAKLHAMIAAQWITQYSTLAIQ